MSTERSGTSVPRSRRSRRWLAWLAIILVPLLIGGFGILLVQQVVSANDLRDAERASQDRRATLMAVLSAHQDVETAQRGFLLTGRTAFLQPLAEGDAALDTLFPKLRSAYAGDRDQLRRLAGVENFSDAKRRFSEGTIELHQAGNRSDAVDLVASGRGKALMDEIRRRIGAMMAAEIEVLNSSTAKAEQATATLRWLAFWLLAMLIFLLAAATLAIGRMMAQRRRTLIDLADTARRRAAILNGAMDGILTLNPSGTIEGINSAAERMFGYEARELVSRDVGMLFADAPPIGQVAVDLREMNLQPDQPGTLREIIGRHKDGRTFPTDVALTVAPLEEGDRYVAVIRDITERQRVEQLKSEFLATVSHELRTPLTSIAGSLGLLTGGAAGELSDRAARLIKIAHTNADRLVRLINDILDIEKLESGKMRFDNRLIELAPTLAQAIEQNQGFAEQYKVHLKLDPGPHPCWVFADPDRLAQVLTNLLSNAIKFSPEGGTVEISLADGRNRHRITVRDQGRGIPEEFRSRIFGKFAQADSSDTRSKGGTGLGLSIVHEIVSQLGGSISYDSRAGEGAQFHVQLPAVSPGEDELDADTEKWVVLFCGEAMAEPLQAALHSSHYELVAAADPRFAHRLIDSRPFDALILDMGLADEEPVQIIRHARRSAFNKNVPIIAIGGEASDDFVSDPAFIVDWLRKPVEIGSIAARLDAGILRWDGDRPTVLHVDDDPDILRVVKAALGEKANVVGAQTLGEARRVLATHFIDLVILDLTLRDGKGEQLMCDLQSAERDIPIVVFSAEEADDTNLSRFEAFLTKARTPMERLVSIVEREAAKGQEKP